MRYEIVTFGCQMNEADSGLMAALLDHAGWEPAGSRDDPDLVVINTCAVREKPEQKVFSLLGHLRRRQEGRPGMVIVVAGCMAQAQGEALVKRAGNVDAVVGTRCFHQIAEVAARVRSGEKCIVLTGLEGDPAAVRCRAALGHGRAPLRALVPIIQGCTSYCTYCVVPYVRGAEISREPGDVLDELRDLVRRGTREVTLLGQNVLAYGRDLPPEPPTTFDLLLSLLDRLEGLWRIRFTTCHPRDVTDALIRQMADLGKVCEHIHLPIQAGTDELLTQMNRGYTTRQYRQLVDRLRAEVPGLAVTTDIMVGFPGETEDDFERSLRLYAGISFDAAFTFAYSPRPGTAAAQRSDQVPPKVRLERLHRLIEAQNRITQERNQAQLGAVVEVLVEGRAERGEGLLAGKTRANKQVVFPGDPSLAGSLVRVRLTEAELWGFRGELAAVAGGSRE